MKSKKYATYAKRSFVLMKIRKMNLNFIIKSEMIAITLGNLGELLRMFAI